MISEVTVHGGLAPRHKDVEEEMCSNYGTQESERQGNSWRRDIPFKGTPQ